MLRWLHSRCGLLVQRALALYMTYLQNHELKSDFSSFSDIASFPVSLRGILEQYLGEEPSPYVLDQLMPELRQLLFDLYRWLLSKEKLWKSATGQLVM